MYMQRFENFGVLNKADFDAAWAIATEAFDRTGNFGGVETGITHHGIYSTTWGGYVLFSAETPAALAEYQKFHYQNYAHGFRITFEPVTNMGAAFTK